MPNVKLYIHPFQIHALALSIFASTIGPFGGFFASGFKRAFKIKDFGDTIPGHGGFMDSSGDDRLQSGPLSDQGGRGGKESHRGEGL